MVKLEWPHILLIIAVAAAVWQTQKAWIYEARIKRLKKENARLRDFERAQDEALRRLAAINGKLISGKNGLDTNKPVLIIQNGCGFVKRGGAVDE